MRPTLIHTEPVIPLSSRPGMPGELTALEADPALLAGMTARRLAAGRGTVHYLHYPGNRLAVLAPRMHAELTVHDRFLRLEWTPSLALDWPGQIAAHLCTATAAILGAADTGRPASRPAYGTPLIEIAGRALAGAGLSAAMDIHADHQTFEVLVSLSVLNVALPGLGKIIIADDAALTWTWPYPPAATAASVADRAAGALSRLLPSPGSAALPASWR